MLAPVRRGGCLAWAGEREQRRCGDQQRGDSEQRVWRSRSAIGRSRRAVSQAVIGRSPAWWVGDPEEAAAEAAASRAVAGSGRRGRVPDSARRGVVRTSRARSPGLGSRGQGAPHAPHAKARSRRGCTAAAAAGEARAAHAHGQRSQQPGARSSRARCRRHAYPWIAPVTRRSSRLLGEHHRRVRPPGTARPHRPLRLPAVLAQVVRE